MKAMIGKVSLALVFGIGAIINLSAQENSHGANLDASQELKPRIVVLTDIAPGDREPDDMESMVRLLSHADLFEIESIITCILQQEWNGLLQGMVFR